MKGFLKENFFIILIVLLPLWLAAPSLIMRTLSEHYIPDPHYKAVFALEEGYAGIPYQYIFTDGYLTINVDQTQSDADAMFREKGFYLVIYDPVTHINTEYTKENIKELKEIKIDPRVKSQDGYVFKERPYQGFSAFKDILFIDAKNESRFVLSRWGKYVPIPDQGYWGNYRFIGWVIDGKAT